MVVFSLLPSTVNVFAIFPPLIWTEKHGSERVKRSCGWYRQVIHCSNLPTQPLYFLYDKLRELRVKTRIFELHTHCILPSWWHGVSPLFRILSLPLNTYWRMSFHPMHKLDCSPEYMLNYIHMLPSYSPPCKHVACGYTRRPRKGQKGLNLEARNSS